MQFWPFWSIFDQSCSVRLVREVKRMFELTAYSIPDHVSVLRCFANCFEKAFASAKKAIKQLRLQKQSKNKQKIKHAKEIMIDNSHQFVHLM